MSGGTVSSSEALFVLPEGLRNDLLGAFEKIVRNYTEARWEPAELNGGKLSEAAYSICDGFIADAMPTRASKPKNMVDDCRALASRSSPKAIVPRSIRIQIPRMIVALYEFRNNRNVGHVGGDVDPNHMDAVCVLQMAKWIVAEFIRVFHELSVDEAAELVDALVEREVPLVWKVGGTKRVLDPSMTMRDRALLLLHGSPGPVAERDLVAWAEHSNASMFRRDILKVAHRQALLHYDPEARTVEISPRGVDHVETKLLKTR